MAQETPDPFKIPLKLAQEWINNWLNYQPPTTALEDSPTSLLRGFLIRRQDLLDLFEQAPDADFVRMYIGLQEGLGNDIKSKTPHLLMVNAAVTPDTEVPGLFRVSDLIFDANGDEVSANVMEAGVVNDYTLPVPPYTDPDSPLN